MLHVFLLILRKSFLSLLVTYAIKTEIITNRRKAVSSQTTAVDLSLTCALMKFITLFQKTKNHLEQVTTIGYLFEMRSDAISNLSSRCH